MKSSKHQHEFEVISNSDTDESISSNEEEIVEDKLIETKKVIGPNQEYSQNDESFMFELYRENRELLESIKENGITITKLEERICYLKNSNMFWMLCYFGSTALGIFSMIR